MISQKKLKSTIKHSQVPLTSKQGIINPKKQLFLSDLRKLKESLVVKTKKKNCQYCDDNFFFD